MGAISSPLTDDARMVTGDALKDSLIDLIELSLLAKQAHWNLIGHQFRSLHLQLDEVAALARAHSDTIAERAVTIGVNPAGRSGTIAGRTEVPAGSGGGHGYGRGPCGVRVPDRERPDVTVVLSRQGGELLALLDQHAGQPPVTPQIRGEDVRRREELLNDLRRRFVAYAMTKQRYLWRVLRRALPDGAAIAKNALGQRMWVEELFVKLRWMPDRDPEINEITGELATTLRGLVRQQNNLLGRVQRTLSREQRQDLGARLAKRGKLTPTRPHPDMPTSSAVAAIAGPLLGVLDRVVDAFTSSPSST